MLFVDYPATHADATHFHHTHILSWDRLSDLFIIYLVPILNSSDFSLTA